MKKLRLKMTILFLFLLGNMISQPIKSTFAGQAYWYSDHGHDYENSSVQNLVEWPKVCTSGVRLVRAGGNQYNISNEKPPYPSLYVRLVDDIREHGCEPVITIPFDYDVNDVNQTFNGQLTASVIKAKEIVRLLNVVHKRHV